MGNRKNYLISCSVTSRKFTLMHDGIETYLIYYDGNLIEEKVSKLDIKEVYDKYWKKNWQEILKDNNPLIETIVECIIDNLEREPKFTDAMMDNRRIVVFKDLITTLYESKHSKKQTDEYLLMENTPQSVKNKFLELQRLYDENPVDEILLQTDIEDEINNRINPLPTLTDDEMEIITEISGDISYFGLLPYLNNILMKIHIGNEHKGIYRKTLAGFNTMRGKGSYLSETSAKQEAGKSFEDDIVFDLIIPPRYIFKVNDFTSASFRRYGAISERYFDRKIVLFGDLGSKNAFKKVEDVFNIFKVLITENEYHSSKADKNDDLKNIELHLKVDSIGAVYQTVETLFTEGDGQLESRTIFSRPPIVEDKEIMIHLTRLNFSKSSQYNERKDAEQELKNFGLFLMYKVTDNKEIVNPYEDVFIDYCLKSENPIRELKQQLQLFDAYCHLTSHQCIEYHKDEDGKDMIWASLEQLTDYMNFVNLENALIPYENNFLQMIKAEGKANELTALYDELDIYDEDGNPIPEYFDIDTEKKTSVPNVPLLIDYETEILNEFNEKAKEKKRISLKADGYDEESISDALEDYEPVQSKDDLNNQQLKEFSRRLISKFGLRSGSSEKKIFFRNSDLKNIYYRYKPYKDVNDVPQLLQSLYKKGYIGKYEEKAGKENIYYLTPKYESTEDFRPQKTFEEYANQFIKNTDCEDILYN